MLKKVMQKLMNSSLFEAARKEVVAGELSKYHFICNAVGTAIWEIEIHPGSPVGPLSRVEWSQNFKQILGFESEQEFPNILQSWSDRLHPDEKEDKLDELLKYINIDCAKSPQFNTECRLLTKNEEYRHFNVCLTVQKNNKGIPVKIVGAQSDISDVYKIENITRTYAQALENKQKIQNSLHELGASLLASNENAFKKSLIRSMNTIGKTINADRLQIWRNEEVGRKLHFSLTDEWLSDYGKELDEPAKCMTYPYEAVPGWEDKLKRGKHINSLITGLLPHESAFFSRQNIKTLVIVPLFKDNDFWGFLRIDDCTTERLFTEEEMFDIKTAAQFMAFSLILSENQERIRNQILATTELTYWYQSILDAIPVPVSVIDANMNLLFANTAVESMVGKKRENLYGKHCSVMGLLICNTQECGIACAKKYISSTRYKSLGKTYQVNVTRLRNTNEEIVGFVEVIQDITALENYISVMENNG